MKVALFFFLLLVVGFFTIIALRNVNISNKTITDNPLQRPAVSKSLPFKMLDPEKIAIYAQSLGSVRDLEFAADNLLLASIPSSGTVVALPDKNNDNKADEIKVIINNLNKPHGIVFYKNKLFVAEETKVSRYTVDKQNLTAQKEKDLFSLPDGGRHNTRSLDINNKGDLFVTIGSTCDVCFEKHPWIGTVIISDYNGRKPEIFASGLRNAVFIAVNPQTDQLWATEMGRDFLGDEKPSDEINIIKEGKNYGWPVCYGNRIYDTSFNQKSPDYCKNTEPPVMEIAAHSAPLGLTFHGGYLYAAYHGSWNRTEPIGYKVVRFKLNGDKLGKEEDVVTGLLQGSRVLGRPVDVIFNKNNRLLISDDRSGAIYTIAGINN